MTCWKPGRRLFSTAAFLMILTAVAHTIGFLAGPETPGEKTVFVAMDALRTPMGMGMNPSLSDVFWSLVFTMSISFAGLGALNLVVASQADAPARTLQALGVVNAVWVGAFLILNIRYQVPPPLLSALVIEVFVVAALLAGRKT